MPADEPLPTSASLLDRLKDLDDQASWEQFHRTYRELIYSVARRSGLNETEADEVVQDTLLAVAKKMPEFKYDPAVDSFKGWLLQVTRWRITDQFRQRASGPSGPGGTPDLPSHRAADSTSTTVTIERVPDPAGFDPAAIWDEEWEKNLLNAALARIKRQVRPEQYEIYHLHVILQKPVREVRRTLGVSAGQVYLAKHRVGSLLKQEIRRLEKSCVERRGGPGLLAPWTER